MANTSDTALLLQTIQFASFKHRDQRRKGSHQAPYINHPIDVATILANVGDVTDIATLQAAILHDTLEDTATSAAELEQAFGAEVTGLVLEMTDDMTLDSATRKAVQIERAPGLSRRAKLIKLGDKIANVGDITDHPPRDWTLERRARYLAWTAEVIAGCRGANAALEARYDATRARGEEVIRLERDLGPNR